MEKTVWHCIHVFMAFTIFLVMPAITVTMIIN